MSNKTDRSKYAHVIDTLGYIIALCTLVLFICLAFASEQLQTYLFYASLVFLALWVLCRRFGSNSQVRETQEERIGETRRGTDALSENNGSDRDVADRPSRKSRATSALMILFVVCLLLSFFFAVFGVIASDELAPFFGKASIMSGVFGMVSGSLSAILDYLKK